jgi:hypothetical protein
MMNKQSTVYLPNLLKIIKTLSLFILFFYYFSIMRYMYITFILEKKLFKWNSDNG